jgi:hypothetical protein
LCGPDIKAGNLSKPPRQLTSRLRSISRLFRQAVEDHAVEHRRNGQLGSRGRRRATSARGERQSPAAFPRKYRFARQQEVADAPERVDIGARIDRRRAERLLGRDIGRRPAHDVVARQVEHAGFLAARRHLRDPEIEHLHEVG